MFSFRLEKSHAFFPFQSEYGIGKDHVNFSRALVQEFHDDFYQENLADHSNATRRHVKKRVEG